MRTSAVLASVALVVLACGSSDDATSSSSGGGGTPLSSEVKSGVATYYTADGAGNCGFDPSPGDLDVAAFDSAQYAGSAACGGCQLVKGPKGSLTVRIVDQCPDCGPNHPRGRDVPGRRLQRDGQRRLPPRDEA